MSDDKLVMGYWDCSYCGTKTIKGTSRNCPNCQHPRDNSVKFYMLDEKQYLSEEEASTKGKGADWYCEYCGALNSVLDETCKGCGSAREEAKKDYFNADEKPEPFVPNASQKKEEKPKKKKSFLPFVFLAAVIFAIVGVVLIAMPKKKGIVIDRMNWAYSIDIEAYETVQESDWEVPDGGRVYETKEEIHHYDQVLDHYETRTRTYTEQVYDGEDVHTEYIDNGDGTFTEKQVSTPRYRNEVREETYEEPIYRDEPVYQTKYYYEIEKWVHSRYIETSGNDKNPVWGEVVLADNEREGAKTEEYSVDARIKKGKKIKNESKNYKTSKAIWEQFGVGETYNVKIDGDEIIEIIKK